MLFQPLDSNFEKKVRFSFADQPFMAYIGANLFEVSPGYCEIHLDFRPELSQQNGYFHGGIIGTLADNAGGYAAYSLMPPNSSVLTVEYKVNLVAPGKGEQLVACGYVLKPGRTLTTCRTEVFVADNGHRKMCATSLMTLICLKQQQE